MNKFPISIRWSDLDPNFHLRHSAYYDFGAYCRIKYLTMHGLSPDVLKEAAVGPILFREEAVFRKEISFGDHVEIDILLQKVRKDFSRWTIVHNLIKNGDQLSAIITVDGAWIDTARRKLSVAPPMAAEVFEQMPRSDSFEWINK